MQKNKTLVVVVVFSVLNTCILLFLWMLFILLTNISTLYMDCLHVFVYMYKLKMALGLESFEIRFYRIVNCKNSFGLVVECFRCKQ